MHIGVIALALWRAQLALVDGSATVELASAKGAGCDLAADATRIYWSTTDNGSVGRRERGKTPRAGGGAALDWKLARSTIRAASKQGGDHDVLASITGDWIFGLAHDATALYWTGLRNGDVWRLPKQEQTPTRLAHGRANVLGTAIGSKHVYASDRGRKPRGVLRLPKDGGAAEVFEKSNRLTVVLGVADDVLYWGERASVPEERWSIRATAIDTHTSTSIAEVDKVPTSFVSSNGAYFIAGRAAYAVVDDGTALRKVADVVEYGDRGSIGADATHLYWADGKTGEVKRAPKHGGASAVVVRGAEPCGVLVEDGVMHWIDRGGSKLMRSMLPKR